MSQTYTANYTLPLDADEAAENTIAAINEPQTLEEIRETCKVTGALAELKDAQRFTRGWVKDDGSYTLI